MHEDKIIIWLRVCVANEWLGVYLNSENVRVAVDLWVATIGQAETV